MTVYIDIIFMENLFMNCIILLCTGIITKTKINLIRIFLASTIGSIYAVLLYIQDLYILSNLSFKIALSILIIYIAFNPKTIKNFFKQLIVFYLTSFTFAGSSLALVYLLKNEILVLEGYPIKLILTGGIVGAVIVIIAFKNIKNNISKNDMICNLKIVQELKKVNMKAIIDTGNFLKDPITKMPVVVVEKQKLYEIIPKQILDNIQNIIDGEEDIDEYISKIRLIPFSSLGKENGMLVGIKVDSIFINYCEKEICVDDVIIGIYNGDLSKNGKYHALIGLEILEYEGGRKYDKHFRTVKV